MIWLNFERWSESAQDHFCYRRIYWKGYKWTPFVRVSRRYHLTTEELQRRIKDVEELRDIQGQDGNWNFDPYMQGLYNGLELASSVLDGYREPIFKEKEIA